ncbi:hypothetical protein [Streptomyces sp. H27-D2]|uniref:hypothetical protein n=1 Tax=Streptomyces sp. H27-D2 TaxID=3046304 RepID=UPI002DBA07B5|nr:hypothetical protein [Streptomyces sp. H27-D2]MEC4019766.1 hypothetical protein [Streptomyces sp. H27-D2]
MTTTLLADIVGEVDSFVAEVWARRPEVFRYAAGPRLLPEAAAWEMVECGLLVAPYFSMLREIGGGATAQGITITREVLGRALPAYADPAAARSKYAAGRVITLNQPEHWHVGIRSVVDGLCADLQGGAHSVLFLSPPGATASAEHTAGQHVLHFQLDGESHWTLPPGPALTLVPGDVLYLPGGQEHRSEAGPAGSFHLAVTIEQPTGRELADLLIAEFLDSPRAAEIAGNHHFLTPAEKTAWLRTELGKTLSALDPAALADRAVRNRQRGGRT